jgi:NhaP-type Na+/H+ or K+/H+ antiporter
MPGVRLAADLVGSIDFSETLLHGMLAFLLFAGALHVNFNDLRSQLLPVAVLSTVGVALATALIGVAFWATAGALGVEIPFIYGLLFGALISPTDPVAVLGVLKNAGAVKSLETKIAGESLFNDGIGVVVFSLPPAAVEFFMKNISRMDALILGLGIALFILQTILSWRALRWRGDGFDEGADRWITHLAQAAEWFPMLGLLGTVGGILQTFSSITGPVSPQVIIAKYAPAVTATGAGLLMAFINILPTWIVITGRDLLTNLGGGVPKAEDAP